MERPPSAVRLGWSSPRAARQEGEAPVWKGTPVADSADEAEEADERPRPALLGALAQALRAELLPSPAFELRRLARRRAARAAEAERRPRPQGPAATPSAAAAVSAVAGAGGSSSSSSEDEQRRRSGTNGAAKGCTAKGSLLGAVWEAVCSELSARRPPRRRQTRPGRSGGGGAAVAAARRSAAAPPVQAQEASSSSDEEGPRKAMAQGLGLAKASAAAVAGGGAAARRAPRGREKRAGPEESREEVMVIQIQPQRRLVQAKVEPDS